MRVSIPIGPIFRAENQYRPIYMIQVINTTTIIVVLERDNTGECIRLIITNDEET